MFGVHVRRSGIDSAHVPGAATRTWTEDASAGSCRATSEAAWQSREDCHCPVDASYRFAHLLYLVAFLLPDLRICGTGLPLPLLRTSHHPRALSWHIDRNNKRHLRDFQILFCIRIFKNKSNRSCNQAMML